MNPPTLKNYAIRNYEDENLNGFFCQLYLTEQCLPYAAGDFSTFCGHLSMECDCEQYMAEEKLRLKIWQLESDFGLWKKEVYQFVSKHCPKRAYGNKYYDNMLAISVHFYIRHQEWFEKWNQVSSMDDLRFLLLRAGDVEQNPGPQINFQYQNEVALRKKIEALERARQRQHEKNKTLVRRFRQMQKDLKRFRFQMDREDITKLVTNPSVQRAAAYAATNFILPGAGTAAATVIEGGRILDATNKVKDAATSLADTCIRQIPELINTHTNLADVATVTLANINNLTSRLQSESGLLGSINKLVKNVTSQVSTMALLVTLIVCMAVLAWDWKIGCATILLVLVYFNWPKAVTDKVRQILNHCGWKFEIDCSDHIPIIGQIAFTLLAFFGVSKIPTDKFYDSLLKRMDAVPKAFTGITKIWDQAGKMFEFVSDEFRIYFLGEQREDLLLEKGMSDEVDNWVKRVKFYLEARQKNLLARDEKCVREVEELFNQMYRWKHTPCIWKSMSSECQRVITSVTPLMNDLFKFACRSTVHEGGPRKAPLAVFLSGDSGRGKSEMLYPLAFSLLAHRKYNMQNARNEIYVRNYETEYWDGYVGQKIAFFDDAFQMRDSPGNPSPEFMEAIRLINTAPAHVHCADLNDKGRFFSSEICIYTTNLKEKFGSYINSINCPEAAMRRLNANAYRIKTNPNFEKEVTLNGKTERRLDPDLIKNCERCEELRIRKGLEAKLKFCPHVQMFDKYDLITDEILQCDMSYGDLVKQLKEYDSNLVNSEEEKLYMYEKLIEDPYIFEMMGDETELFEDASDSVHDGAIDFLSATDVVAYNSLLAYCSYLTTAQPEGLGMKDMDLVHSEISSHPSLWATYSRLQKCGMKNREHKDSSLVTALQAHEIGYNHNSQIYHSRQNVWYSFSNVYASFRKYISRLGEQLTYIWNNSGLGETLSFVYIGLVFLSLSALAYNGFSACKCPVCKMNDDACDCIRVVQDGYLYKGQLYRDDEYEMEVNSYETPKTIKPRYESDVRPLINQNRNMRVESDVKPLIKTQQNMRVESDVKPLIKTQQNMKVESDVKPLANQAPKMKIEILEPEKPLQVEMYQDQGCEMLENKIVSRSLYLLHDDVKPYGNVLFIKGTCFLINYHYLEILKQSRSRDHVLYLSNRSSKLVEFTFGSMLDNHVRLYKNDEPVDAAIVWLCPKEDRVSPHTNILNLFIKTEDLSMLNGNYAAQLPTFNSNPNDICISKRSLHDVKMSMNRVRINDENVQMEINHCWQYGGSTSSGDCGAPIILNNNSALRKIVGIHMASNGYIGMAQTITQESLRDALSKIDARYQMCVEIDIACEPILGDSNVCGSVPLDKGLIIHGKTDVPLSSGNNSKIIPSPFFDYVPHKTIPAKLRASKGVDPMYNGLIKYGKSVPRINPKYIDIAVNDVKNNFVINECFKEMRDYSRVLSYEEALIGVPGDEFLAPINRSTSMGYPYTMTNEKLRGKRDAFGDDEWDLNSPLALQVKADVEKLIQNCRDGIQTGVYWSDTLKDERRPIAKVEAGKTRVFCGGPVHFTIAFRQYFLGFAAWMMHNRNDNEVSVGTNVYSPDWNDIVRKLASRAATKLGIKVVAGDFSNFDGSLSSQILWAILDAINEWYDDGPENAQIRRTLWMHIVHAIHINRDVIYQATHSQPSGCPITAILNSIYNSIIIRIAYMICAQLHFEQTGEDFRSMKWFNLFVAMVSYGDDNLIGISEKIIFWFNQNTITTALLVIGHEYTDEAKTGIIVPVRDISEVAYLKRHFKWNPALNRYVAPLDLDTVLEIVQWTKKGLASDAITLANLDVTMRELSLHDRETFDKYKKILYDECIKNKVMYRFATQNEYIAAVCDEPLFLEINRDFSLVKTNKKMPRNYIMMDKNSKTLFVNEYDEDILKRKLSLFCYYRRINVGYVNGWHVAAPQNPGNQGACVWIKWFYAQRNSLAQNSINSKNTSDLSDTHSQATEQVEIIGFQDEGVLEEVQAPLQNTQTPKALVMASTQENKTHTIPGFLGRLYEIDNFQWAVTSPAGTVLKQYRFPDVLLAQPALSRKAYNFFGLRAGVEFVVLVNKQPFQQGNLLISYLPGAKYNDAKNAMCQTTTPTASSANLSTLSGMPRTNLDLMDASKAKLKVPYAAPYVYYNLLSGDGTIGDFYITVYSPLQDVASSGTVSVQVMARFIDVDLQFPAGNSLASFSKTPAVESLYNTFIQKPDLSTLKQLVEEGTSIMEKVKSGSFRFQMNSENVQTQNFKPRALPNMSVANESNNAHLLSLSSSNNLPSINMGEASKMENSFLNIVQIPTYNSRFNITSSQNAGTNVWSKQVTLLDYTNVAPDGSIGVDYPTFLGQNFSKWRSSFKFNFRFIKTMYHSLRVRIFFAPNTTTVAGVDRNAVISKIIDLKVNNFVEFEVPFIWPHPFLNTDTDLPHSLGMIGVDILTKMVHPDTVKNTIEVIVERSAGTDFDLNLPKELTYFPYDPRVEEEELVVSGRNHYKVALPDVVPLESGEEVRVFTTDPINPTFMQTMQNLPTDIKGIISANPHRFNQSKVGALDELAALGHKVTPKTITLDLPDILAKHEELRKKRGVDTVDGWVRDLTRDGVEPNPGPVTYQGWSLSYIIDSFSSGNSFSLTIPSGTWRCYYNYSTDTGGTGFTGTTLATPWGNVSHIAYDAVPCSGYIDLVAAGATSVSFTITKTAAADNNFRVAFTLCGNPIPTVELSGIPAVSISNEPVAVSISGTPNVSVTNTPNVSVTNTPDVNIINTSVPTIAIDQPLQVINVSRAMSDDFKFQMNTEQDDYRDGYDDTSYIRPVNSIQADKMSLGGKISNIDSMIKRSTLYSSLTTSGTNDIYLQPHMIGVARKNALSTQLYGPTDMISYYANLFAFARGGINLRIASSPDFAYSVILDPDSNTLSAIDTDALGQIASPTGSALTRGQSVSIQQVVKPSLEGYGEWSVPFYSDTFMYYINPVLTQSPSVAALNMQCPYTTTIVRPNGAYTQFNAYRAACKDFEFSYLTGAPRISAIV